MINIYVNDRVMGDLLIPYGRAVMWQDNFCMSGFEWISEGPAKVIEISNPQTFFLQNESTNYTQKALSFRHAKAGISPSLTSTCG